jgi:hypothetical protein
VKVGANLSIDANGVLSAQGGGSSVTVDAELSATSTNPVQNKVVTAELSKKADLYSDWSWDAAGTAAEFGQPTYNTYDEQGYWWVDYLGLPWSSVETGEDATELHFEIDSGDLSTVTATRTRLTTMADVNAKENASNKVTSLSAQSTDAQYPSAKCVYDGLAKIPYDLPAAPITPTPGAPFVPATCFPISWEDGDTHDEYEVTISDRARISVEPYGDGYIVSHSEYGGICIVNADGTYDNLEGVVQWVSLNGSYPTTNVTPVLGFTPTYELADRTMNQVVVASPLPENGIALAFPDATAGKVRDFLVRLVIPAGDAPQIAYPEGVTFENADGSFPEIAADENAACATMLMFTETRAATTGAGATPACFLAKGEKLAAIASGGAS